MINLCNRTEYSYLTAFGILDKVLDAQEYNAAGICDRHGTWGHVAWQRACKKRGIKPIFGVELGMVDDPTLKENETLRFLRFIALSNKGLKELYELTTLATGQFHYFPRLAPKDILALGNDVMIFTPVPLEHYNPETTLLDLNPTTGTQAIYWALENNIAPVATSDNHFPTPADEVAWAIAMGRWARKKSTPAHILDMYDWRYYCPVDDPEYQAMALANGEAIAEGANVELPRAELVHPKVKKTLRQMCLDGVKKRGLEMDERYTSRLERELSLIKEKDFEDYFFLIADLCQFAKKHMLVGPARGSSCGSLVCYLLGITEVDPMPYDLLFERFIDVNRADLPDIDIDFPDTKREMVFEYLKETYGHDCVAQLGTVLKFKGKSVVNQVCKELKLPMFEASISEFKEMLIERPAGDARADKCVLDSFSATDAGKKAISIFPELMIATEIEGHAQYSGKHAAGIVVTADPVSWYCSVDQQTGAAMVDKVDAEDLNLLKIDALGLRTLSVIEDCLEQIGWGYDQLINYKLDDEAAFQVMNNKRFAGLFQFEGETLQGLVAQFEVTEFDDIVSLTSLGRPGPLSSGMTEQWLKRKKNSLDPFSDQEVEYPHPLMEDILGNTFGVLVYQEQVMQMCRIMGRMSWPDVSKVRKAMGKSMGAEFFNQYRDMFLEGAKENGWNEEEAGDYWEKMIAFGAYGFNKSHAVAYSMVTYWCMVLKAHFPLEYAAACLRHSKDVDQSIRLLRELDAEGVEFIPFDKDLSEKNWIVKDGQLIGGLMNVIGIAEKTADNIIANRISGEELTKKQTSLIEEGVTPFDNIFEGREKYGHIYENPSDYNILSGLTYINDITADSDGTVVFLAKITDMEERNSNDPHNIAKRGGKRFNGKQPKYLSMKLADDTGEIQCLIMHDQFIQYAQPLLDDKENVIGSWFCFKGSVNKGWRNVKLQMYRSTKKILEMKASENNTSESSEQE